MNDIAKSKENYYRTTPSREWAHLVVLILLSAILTLPFVFQGTYGEVDSMRMALGICRSLVDHSELTGYNSFFSFGYYKFLGLFAGIFTDQREYMIPVMNGINAISGILTVIPCYFLFRKFWREGTAFISTATLICIPTFWNTTLYGHPMIPSLFVFCWAMVLLARAPTFGKREFTQGIIPDIGATALLFVALSLRLDVALLFPSLLGLIWMESGKFWNSLIKTAVLTVISVTLVLVVAKLTIAPGGHETASSQSIFQGLAKYHNPSRFLSSSLRATTIVVFAWHPLICLAALLGLVHLVRTRRWSALVFVNTGIFVNYIFWMPNPSPARHYLFAAPYVAIAAGIGLGWLIESRLSVLRSRVVLAGTLMCVLSVLMAEVTFPVAQRLYPWKLVSQNHSYRVPIRSIPVNKYYAQKEFLRSAPVAQRLLTIKPGARPLMLVTDYPLAIGMQLALLADEPATTWRAAEGKTPGYMVSVSGQEIFMPEVFRTPPEDIVTSKEFEGKFELRIDDGSQVARYLERKMPDGKSLRYLSGI